MTGNEISVATIFARRARPVAGGWMIVAVAVMVLAVALASPQPLLRWPALVSGATLLGLVGALVALAQWRRHRAGQLDRRLASLMAQDAAPCFTTDSLGEIGFRNSAATARIARGRS